MISIFFLNKKQAYFVGLRNDRDTGNPTRVSSDFLLLDFFLQIVI